MSEIEFRAIEEPKIRKKFEPVLRMILEEIHGRYTLETIRLSKIGYPYDGWVDANNYHGYYFSIFDLDNQKGKEMKEKFWRSETNKVNEYNFIPNNSFQVRGILAHNGQHNNLEWVVLKKID